MHMHFVRGTAYKATSFLAEQRSFSAAFENVTVYKEYLLKEGTFLNSLICADVPLRNHSLTLSEPILTATVYCTISLTGLLVYYFLVLTYLSTSDFI